MDRCEMEKSNLAHKIAGEIVLSPSPGKTIQKWRGIFKVSQRKLGDEMKVMPSVISDYEKGRRASPGSKIIKRIVDALISYDEKNGSVIIHEFSSLSGKDAYCDAILDIMEFTKAITVKEFCRAIGATNIIGDNEREVNGYTLVDSAKAIVEMPAFDLVKVYGATSKRALIFTGAHSGRSSMVAVKVSNLKPALVVLHINDGSVDTLTKRIADAENIPLAVVKSSSVENLKNLLRKVFATP